MAAISTWDTTAANNNSASPDGWPEGMAPSGVNDSARENMSALRTWYEDAEWIPWGDTTAYVGATQFKIAGADVTSRYLVNRRVRVVGTSTGTIYGVITVSAFSTDTTVTVAFDSGSMSSETLTVSLGIIIPGRTLPVAVQADMEAGTNTELVVTPGRQQFHPSAAKMWTLIDGDTATAVSVVDYNLTGITDNSAGNYTATIANDMSSANYVSQATVNDDTAITCRVEGQTAGALTVVVLSSAHGSIDDKVGIAIWGTLA